MPAAQIEAEMRPSGVLRPVIKSLVAGAGAYVVVSSKGSVTDGALQRRLKAMREAVATEPLASRLTVDFYDRVRLAAWVRSYPGVEMWVRERVGDRLQGWQPYGNWSSDQTNSPYHHDPSGRVIAKTSGNAEALSAAAGIDSLRQKLRSPGNVVRLVGLSGTGKTRLVQALFETGVGTAEPLDTGLAIYTDLGHAPEPSARDMLLRLGATHQRAIVIVDNCNPGTHRALTDIVAVQKSLSLITVEYDVADDEPEATEVFELTPASDAVLENILARLAPQVTQTDRSRIAEFSSGNARVALALARTVLQGQTLGVLNDSELFRRLFVQNQDEDETLLRSAEALALVYSFDGEDFTTGSSELRVLAVLADCSPRELFRHVDTLKRRDLVQVRGRWRAVLPQALANRLAKSALAKIPHRILMEALAPHERLLRSFSRRLGYLHDSDKACAIAARWIDEAGWLSDATQLDELKTSLFFNLAPLVPEMALKALENALGGEQGKVFAACQSTSFHRWLSLARSLAYDEQYFERAAQIVLAFAEAEEGRRTDCRSAWKELFQVVLSGTMAPPGQRARLLKSLLQEGSPSRQELAVEGIAAMLKAGHFNSSHNFSFGARPRSIGWTPRKRDALLEWFDTAFELLRATYRLYPVHRNALRSALSTHFRSLWHHDVLHGKLIALSHELAESDGWPGGWVAARGTIRFDGPGMGPVQLGLLRELEAALLPKTLRQEVLTYAMGHASVGLDVSDGLDKDDETEDANPVSAYERVRRKTEALGELVSQDDGVLSSVLVELLSAEHGRQLELGRGLGRASPTTLRHWRLLYDAYVALEPSQRNAELLRGFIQGARKSNPLASDELIDTLVSDVVLGPLFPYLLGWPQDDRDGDRLELAIEQGLAPSRFFNLGIERPGELGLSTEKYCAVTRRIAAMKNGLPVAIDSLATELHHFKSRPAELPNALLKLGRDLLTQFAFDVCDDNLAYRLKVLAGACFAGVTGAPYAKEFSARFATALDDYRTRAESLGNLACTLFKLQPTVSLDTFLLGTKRRKQFTFRSTFDFGECPMVECAPLEAIQQWVKVDSAMRLPLVAAEIGILDRESVEEPRWSGLAEYLLNTADDKGPVLRAFANNFDPSGWSGSLGQALRPYVKLVERLVSQGSGEIAAWAQRELVRMNERIAAEERMERRSEQRFE
jgi:hypothetical protein